MKYSRFIITPYSMGQSMRNQKILIQVCIAEDRVKSHQGIVKMASVKDSLLSKLICIQVQEVGTWMQNHRHRESPVDLYLTVYKLSWKINMRTK